MTAAAVVRAVAVAHISRIGRFHRSCTRADFELVALTARSRMGARCTAPAAEGASRTVSCESSRCCFAFFFRLGLDEPLRGARLAFASRRSDSVRCR